MTFWSLSLSDLQVPEATYARCIQALELEKMKIDERELVCLEIEAKHDSDIYLYAFCFFIIDYGKETKRKREKSGHH